MTGKIIGKRVVPDVFEVYEKDVGVNGVSFSVSKVNDGVNFEDLKGFAHIDFESGKTDRAMLNKTVGETEITYVLPITKAITGEEGRHRIQLSFESEDLSVVYKTCIFSYVVCESIDGNLAFENLVPSVVNELEEKMEQTLIECNNLKDETVAAKGEVVTALSNVEELFSDVSNLKTETQNLNDDVLNTNNKVLSVESRVEKVENDILNTQLEVSSTNGRVGDLNTDMDALKTDTADLKEQVLNAKDGAIEAKNQAEQSALSASQTKSDVESIKDNISQVFEEMGSLKWECENLRNDVFIDKDMVWSFKNEAQQAYENTKQFYYDTVQGSYVTSINSKTGDVVLTASDIEGLETAQIEPLHIDGVTYDGKSEVTVFTDKEYEVINKENETYDLHIKNKNCVFVKYVQRLNLYSDMLEGLDGVNAEMYLRIYNEIEFWASAKFHFYGDGCHYGIFQPFKGDYHMRFYSIEKSATIYVEVTKLKDTVWQYGVKSGFPVVCNYDSDYYVSNVRVFGNIKTETIDGKEVLSYPIRGVGEEVLDENGDTKYKVDIITQNANVLSVVPRSDAVDSYCIEYFEDLEEFTLTGITYMEYETNFELNAPIKKGSTVFMKAFNLSSNVVTELTDGLLLEFSLVGDSGELYKIGIDYAGNPCFLDGYGESVTLLEDVNYLKVKVLERAIGTQFDNRISVAVSKDEPLLEFVKSKTCVTPIYMSEPLLKVGTVYDQLNLDTASVSRHIRSIVIPDKSVLTPKNESSDAPAILKYSKDYPAVSQYGNNIWFSGKTIQESVSSVTRTSTYLEFKSEVFGTYNNFDESVFPLRLIYQSSQRNEILPLKPTIKVFEGNTTFDISGGEAPSGGSAPLVKK